MKDNASQHRASGCTNLCPEKENEETIIVPVKKSRKKVVAEKKEPGAVVEDVAEHENKRVVSNAPGVEIRYRA